MQFTDAERADPKLEKPIRKAEKVAARADKRQAKIPNKAVNRSELAVDPKTGKLTKRLYFEEVDKKKPPSKLSHALRDAPANTVLGAAHREIRKSEDDNVGVESAHRLEETAETGGRLIQSAHRSHQLQPYRKAAQAERRLEKANVNFLYQKAMRADPQLSSNPISRWQQKWAIKKQYAAAKYAGHGAARAGSTAASTAKGAKKAAREAKDKTAFVWRHKKGFAIAIGIVLVLALFLNGLSSCSVLFQGGGGAVGISSYQSEDADILGAEAAYAGMEAELQEYLDTYESTHDYDEYHYDLDEIEHDPYVLISILSALHEGPWTLDEVQDTLEMLFDKQYILTESVVVGKHATVPKPLLTRKPARRPLSRFPTTTTSAPSLWKTSTSPMCRSTSWARNSFPCTPFICPPLETAPTCSRTPPISRSTSQIRRRTMRYPAEALEDETFAAMMEEATKYVGFPYVWGGSSPDTSFDCSGFVSWVINHSGWDVGRLGAQGLYNICTPVSTPQPGDLVFFTGTYDTPGVSHVVSMSGTPPCSTAAIPSVMPT